MIKSGRKSVKKRRRKEKKKKKFIPHCDIPFSFNFIKEIYI